MSNEFKNSQIDQLRNGTNITKILFFSNSKTPPNNARLSSLPPPQKSLITPPVLLKTPPNNAKLPFLLPPQKSLITSPAPPAYFAPDGYPELDYESNQGQCGDCWAVGSMNSISDRYVIANGGKNPHFSPLEVISCTYGQTYTINYKNYADHPEELSPLACQGGYPEAACLFSEKNGVGFDNGNTQRWLDSSGCSSDTNPLGCYNNMLPYCAQFQANNIKTVEGSTKSLVIVSGDDSKSQINTSQTIENMKREIYYNGPIIGKYSVYSDFQTYSMDQYANNPWPQTNNIYIHSKDNSPYKGLGTVQCPGGGSQEPELCNMGNHVVEIVGYGTDKAVPKYGEVDYWIIRNSWGGQWGQKINNSKYGGYCKIAMWAGGPSQNFQLMDINKDIGLDIPFAIDLSTSTTISLYSPLFWNNPTFGGAVSVDVKCKNPPCGRKIRPAPKPPAPGPPAPGPPAPAPGPPAPAPGPPAPAPSPGYKTPSPKPAPIIPQKGLPVPVIIGISIGVISIILILILLLI